MGVDQPGNFKRTLPQYEARLKTSGGTKSQIRGPGRFPIQTPFAGVGRQIAGAVNTIMGKIQQNRANNKARDDQLALAKLKAEEVGFHTTSNQSYENEYAGSGDDYTSSYNDNVVRPHHEAKLGRIEEEYGPDVRSKYEGWAVGYHASNQLSLLDQQQKVYRRNFSSDLAELEQVQDDTLRKSPTTGTFQLLIEDLDNLAQGYVTNPNVDQASIKELEKNMLEKRENLARLLINEQLKVSPEQAEKTLYDPEINKYLSPEQSLSFAKTIGVKIKQIQDLRNKTMRRQATSAFDSWITSIISGKESSTLGSKVAQFDNEGFLSEEQYKEGLIANSLKYEYRNVLDSLPGLTENEQQLAIEAYDPRLNGTPVDEDFDLKVKVYNRFKSFAQESRNRANRDPFTAVAQSTGETDIETLRQHVVTTAIQKGNVPLNQIKIASKDDVDRTLATLNTLVAGGKVDEVLNFYNDQVVPQFEPDEAHPERQVAPNITYADMFLNQLKSASQNPLTTKVIAAMMLVPPGQKFSGSNSFLLRAAFINKDQQSKALTAIGLKGNDLWTKLNSNKLFQSYFSVANPSPETDKLIQAHQDLIYNAVLLSASGPNPPTATGGFLGIGQTSSLDNSINSVIQDFLPYVHLNDTQTSASSAAQYTAVTRNISEQNPLQGTTVGGLATINGKKIRKVNIDADKVLIPKEYVGRIDRRNTALAIGAKLADRDFVTKNLFLVGATDQVGQPTAKEGTKEYFHQVAYNAAVERGVPPGLLHAQITQESGWRPNVVSKAGAIGIGQFMPATAQGRGLNPRDPVASLKETAKWLEERHNTYLPMARKMGLGEEHAWKMALASYNAGPGAVQKYLSSHNGLPPYKETQHYIKTIMSSWKRMGDKVPGNTSAPKLNKSQENMLNSAVEIIVNQPIRLTNTPDLNGVQINVLQNGGRYAPLMMRNGQPFTMSFDEIAGQ
jgi:hypothetical protein